jgi:UDP-N-acetylmuramoyl-L-alanine---L-glutamate ligase
LLVVTMPDNGAEIADAIAGVEAGSPVHVEAAEDLRQAVSTGFGWARPDGVVLLSPAAASFGRFANYRERSAAFRAAVAACRTGTSA